MYCSCNQNRCCSSRCDRCCPCKEKRDCCCRQSTGCSCSNGGSGSCGQSSCCQSAPSYNAPSYSAPSYGAPAYYAPTTPVCCCPAYAPTAPTAPTAPSINAVYTDSTIITGVGTPACQVTVRLLGGAYEPVNVTVEPDGYWAVEAHWCTDPPCLEAGQVIMATQVCTNNAVSAPSRTVVQTARG